MPLCHQGEATSRNATCSSPEQRHPTTHATTAAAAAPAPRPSATAPHSLLSLARHYSDALPHLPSAALRGRRARSFVQRAGRGGRRPVTRHRAASGSRWSREGGEWRPRRRRPRPRRRRRGTRSTTTAVLPSGRRCRGAPSAPAAAPRLLDLPVSLSLIDPLPVLLIIFFILCNV